MDSIVIFRNFFLVFIGLSTISALAIDEAAKGKLSEAQKLYLSRTDGAKVEAALAALATAEREATDTDLKYDIKVLTSKILYWKAEHLKTDGERAPGFESGRIKAAEARTMNSDYADAFYWYAANLARWGGIKRCLSFPWEEKRTDPKSRNTCGENQS